MKIKISLIALLFLLLTSCSKSEDIIIKEDPPNLPVQIICVGNSIVDGWPLDDSVSYPSFIRKDLGYATINLGIGAISTTQMLANPLNVDTLNFDNKLSILVVDEATNDIYYGADGTATYNNYIRYCVEWKANNPELKIVLIVPTPRNNGPADFEVKRQALRTLLLNNYSPADILIDLASDSLIGFAGCETNTVYYLDGCHMTIEGNKYRAKLIETGIKKLISK